MANKSINKEKIKTLRYKHIYLLDGFALSKDVTLDGKAKKPKRKHVCIEFGYLCKKQLAEQRIQIVLRYPNKTEKIYPRNNLI